ncbi:hypothetical protein BZG36_05056, partial [Bifiguratus adelaidae]
TVTDTIIGWFPFYSKVKFLIALYFLVASTSAAKFFYNQYIAQLFDYTHEYVDSFGHVLSRIMSLPKDLLPDLSGMIPIWIRRFHVEKVEPLIALKRMPPRLSNGASSNGSARASHRKKKQDFPMETAPITVRTKTSTKRSPDNSRHAYTHIYPSVSSYDEVSNRSSTTSLTFLPQATRRTSVNVNPIEEISYTVEDYQREYELPRALFGSVFPAEIHIETKRADLNVRQPTAYPAHSIPASKRPEDEIPSQQVPTKRPSVPSVKASPQSPPHLQAILDSMTISAVDKSATAIPERITSRKRRRHAYDAEDISDTDDQPHTTDKQIKAKKARSTPRAAKNAKPSAIATVNDDISQPSKLLAQLHKPTPEEEISKKKLKPTRRPTFEAPESTISTPLKLPTGKSAVYNPFQLLDERRRSVRQSGEAKPTPSGTPRLPLRHSRRKRASPTTPIVHRIDEASTSKRRRPSDKAASVFDRTENRPDVLTRSPTTEAANVPNAFQQKPERRKRSWRNDE